MLESAKIYFKEKGSPKKAKLNPKIFASVGAVALLVGGHFYLEYLHNLKHSAAPNTASLFHSTPVAVVTNKPDQAATASAQTPADGQDSEASAGAAKPDLSDSLMAALVPSAKAETVQPEMAPVQTQPATTVPAARQPLQARVVVHHDPAPLTEEQKLWQAAQASFGNAMDMARHNPDIFGFTAYDQFDDAKLEQPVRVYTIAGADLKNYQPGQPVKPLLQATNEWIFPVTLGNRIRLMVPVKRVGDDYVAESVSRSLAIVYQKILESWPASGGFHPQLVMNAGIANYYFTVPELPDPNLTDTSAMLEYNPMLSPASVILASWQ